MALEPFLVLHLTWFVLSFRSMCRVSHRLQFGYSFMLHFYSSPLTHIVKPEALPSRPDVNVIFTIYVPLLQASEYLLAMQYD